MPFYQKGDVRVRYEETGSGFPLLVTPGGGVNSPSLENVLASAERPDGASGNRKFESIDPDRRPSRFIHNPAPSPE